MQIGVVMIGYSRFDWIEKNLRVVNELSLPYLIYIDGSSSKKINSLQEQFIESDIADKNRIVRGDINRGVRYFIPFSISMALKSFDYLIVLEDDIEVSRDSIQFVIENMSWLDKGLISLFQPIICKNSFVNKYGGIWGWAVSKQVWSQFELGNTLPLSFKSIMLDHSLLKAIYFYPLLELSRMGVSKSWAYEFLSHRWQKNIHSLQPSSSLAQNHGLGDIFAENTKRRHPFAKVMITSYKRTTISYGKNQSLMELTGFTVFGLLLRSINAWLRLFNAKIR